MFNNFLVPLVTSSSNSTGSLFGSLWIFIPIILIFYFLLIRPQRKKEKKDAQMRKSLEIGDEVTTAGGIVGIIFSVKEDTVVIETGGDRSKIRVKTWAIAENHTVHENNA